MNKKTLLLYLGFVFSAASIFGQEIPQLKVTNRDMTNVIFRYWSDNQTVVEIKSNVKLEFESTMDKKVDVHNFKEDNGYYYYELLFPTGDVYKGRKLQIKSYGFDTYTQVLDLKTKTPVGLLVLNDTKRKADSFYEEGNFCNALKEYEKLLSINPNYEYVKSRIEKCSIECYGGGDAMTLFQKGLEYSKAGNYTEAIQCYHKSLDKDPNNDRVWYNLGIAYGRIKKNFEAEECYRKAAKLGNKEAQNILTLIGKGW